MMKPLFPHNRLAIKELLRRADRVAADLNVLLVVVAIGLAALDMTFLVDQKVVDNLPPITRVSYDPGRPPGSEARASDRRTKHPHSRESRDPLTRRRSRGRVGPGFRRGMRVFLDYNVPRERSPGVTAFGMKCAAGSDNGLAAWQGSASGCSFGRACAIFAGSSLSMTDAALRQSLAEQLELHAEFASLECDSAARPSGSCGRSVRRRAARCRLPDMNGHELCREMRRAGITVPIVMLTAADSEADTVLGLDAGANDYVTKPFRLSVLLARLRAHLRQSELNDDAVLTIGPTPFGRAPKLMTDAAVRRRCASPRRKPHPQIPLSRRTGDRPRHAVGRGLGV